MRNKGKGVSKEDLAKWVSLGLKEGLTLAKIQKGFSCTGISPLNPRAMDPHMAPSECFAVATVEQDQDNDSNDDSEQETHLDKVAPWNFSIDCVPETHPKTKEEPQFFVEENLMEAVDVDSEATLNSDREDKVTSVVQNFFELHRWSSR